MKQLIILITMLISLNGYSLECPDGSKLMNETVTSRGTVRKEHCRKTPAKLTVDQKIAKLNELKKSRPDLAAKIDDKIKSIK